MIYFNKSNNSPLFWSLLHWVLSNAPFRCCNDSLLLPLLSVLHPIAPSMPYVVVFVLSSVVFWCSWSFYGNGQAWNISISDCFYRFNDVHTALSVHNSALYHAIQGASAPRSFMRRAVTYSVVKYLKVCNFLCIDGSHRCRKKKKHFVFFSAIFPGINNKSHLLAHPFCQIFCIYS